MAQDWVEQYENRLDYAEAMARLVAMHRLIGQKRRSAAASNYKLKVFLLIASAVTTGALWVLLGGAFSEIMKWVGAVLSSVVTGLNAFQLTVGPAKVVEQLDDLYSEFGRSLAHAREHPNNFSWHNFKHLESAYLRNGVAVPTPEEVSSARISGMI
jgi:hypothetical protein